MDIRAYFDDQESTDITLHFLLCDSIPRLFLLTLSVCGVFSMLFIPYVSFWLLDEIADALAEYGIIELNNNPVVENNIAPDNDDLENDGLQGIESSSDLAMSNISHDPHPAPIVEGSSMEAVRSSDLVNSHDR